MKKLSLILLLLVSFLGAQSQPDTLIVHYYENYPYAYTESGKLKGIEIEIIESYVAWLQERGANTRITYKPYKEFSAFYNSVKEGGDKVIGLGSVTINSEREKEVAVTAPYLQNVAVLITAGKVPVIKERSATEVSRVLGNMKSIVVNKSTHAAYVNEIKKSFLPGLKVETTELQKNVLDKIVTDNSYFGYVDIIAYWAYLRNNQDKFLKIQKTFNETNEYLGFILPKKSAFLPSVNEFFESGFGFTATKAYHNILGRYLGYEIIGSVEIK
jgi:ABC-type amino acid transport substrate-binding protein